jgi:energy-converting hydrogenase Eha subunit B
MGFVGTGELDFLAGIALFLGAVFCADEGRAGVVLADFVAALTFKGVVGFLAMGGVTLANFWSVLGAAVVVMMCPDINGAYSLYR